MERLTEREGIFVKSKFKGEYASQNILARLAEYEDAEEQGLILRLPCKVGSTVYVIDKYCIANNVDDEECESNELCEMCRYYKKYVVCEKVVNNIFEIMMMSRNYGKFRFGENAFLTREEAEQALAEMQKG